MVLLWAILTMILAIVLFLLGFSGIAIAISPLTKFLFLLALICFLISLVLIFIETHQKHKAKQVDKFNF